MMLAWVLALSTPSAQPVPSDAVEAERAFAADAQTIGQWAAFRKWAAPDATMFSPQPVNAQTLLASLKEPARAVEWRPAESYVSCDGAMAANTGPTRWPGGRVGYFSTIWQRGERGWRWTVDHGDFTGAPRWSWDLPPKVRRASCSGKITPAPEIAFRCAPQASGKGGSVDGTLRYFWYIACGGGNRSLLVWLWNGKGWDSVLSDAVALKPPR